MLPIIVKDLAENLKIWTLFAAASVIATLLPTGEAGGQVVKGFIQAITLGGGLVFAHSVVFAERRRRHLVFLRTLPVTDSEIVGAKFISALMLTLSLAVMPLSTLLFLGKDEPGHLTILSLSFLSFYTSLVLGLYICFRNPALPFLPLYGSALLVLWGGRHIRSIEMETGIILSLLASGIIYRAVLAIFRRKELDF